LILADASIWVEHLRRGHAGLAAALNRGEVLAHPLIVGEIACGSLRNRAEVLQLLDSLPQAAEASHEEVRNLIERQALFSLGVGIVDVHLLASARLSKAPLWTLDRRLRSAAQRLDVAYAG
jgi:predicted nucleic acid-binding protein